MRDTAHLSMLEDACLGRMLRWYYANEKPLPADIHQVYRLVRCAAQKEREAVDTVLQEFFVLREDGYHQKRADAEIARYQAKQSKARASVNSRWERQRLVKQTNNGGTTGELPTLYERITDDIHRAPVPKNQEPRTNNQRTTTTTPLPRVPADRGSRLAEGWEPSKPCRDWAATQCPDIDFDWALEAFRDYWLAVPGQKGRKLDWERTLKNRLRDLQDRHKLRPQSTYKPADIDAWLAKEDT